MAHMHFHRRFQIEEVSLVALNVRVSATWISDLEIAVVRFPALHICDKPGKGAENIESRRRWLQAKF